MKVAGFAKKGARTMGQVAGGNVLQREDLQGVPMTWCGRFYVWLMEYAAEKRVNASVFNGFGWLMRFMMQLARGRAGDQEGADKGAGGVCGPVAGLDINALLRMRILAQKVINRFPKKRARRALMTGGGA